jgi:hypothetical protein
MGRNSSEIMKIALKIMPVLLLTAAPLAAQSQMGVESEKDAVIRASLDYLEGAETADAARMERAIHPEVTKVLLAKYPQTGATYLRNSGAAQLVEVVRAGAAFLEEERRNTEVTVHDIGYNLASATVVSTQFIDHLLLAKVDEQWKIIDVLWVPNTPDTVSTPTAVDLESEKQAITSTALDYIEGAYTGDGDRMANALHPELTKVLIMPHPKTGNVMLIKMGATMLVEGTRARLGLLEEDKRNIEVTVYHVGNDLATARVISAMYIDHLQLAKIDGHWKIVNVLWVPNPAARRET